MTLESFIESERLPASFAAIAEDHYAPLAERVEAWLAAVPGRSFVVGINGAQGTGKSTLARFLAAYLSERYGRSVAELSIDDLYLALADRRALAERVHPLLVTRGVPGTHDVGLGISVIQRLRSLGAGETLALPRFDKAADDRRPETDWPIVEGPVDLVVFEGWCVGSTAEPGAALEQPVNALEAAQDPDGAWRRYVNDTLAASYPALFGLLDALIFLKAPDFDCVRRWRQQQEAKLAQSAAPGAKGIMDGAALARFVQHYERITRHNMATLADRADVVFELGRDHGIRAAHYRTGRPVAGA